MTSSKCPYRSKHQVFLFLPVTASLCVRLIAGGGGGVRVGSGVHGSYTFPVQTDGVYFTSPGIDTR